MSKEIRTADWPHGGRYWECEFENGVENGKFRSWHSDGSSFEEGQYVNGKRNGTWKMSSPDGIETTLEIRDDVLVHKIKRRNGRVLEDKHYSPDGEEIESE